MAVASVCFGSNYVPLKGKPAGDGLAVQWLMACCILLVGYGVMFVAMKVILVWEGLLGGMLFAVGNALVIPCIRLVGLGPAFLLWSSTNMLNAWAIGFFGLFGVAAETITLIWLNLLGVVFAIASLAAFVLIKPTLKHPSAEMMADEDEEEEEEATDGINVNDINVAEIDDPLTYLSSLPDSLLKQLLVHVENDQEEKSKETTVEMDDNSSPPLHSEGVETDRARIRRILLAAISDPTDDDGSSKQMNGVTDHPCTEEKEQEQTKEKEKEKACFQSFLATLSVPLQDEVAHYFNHVRSNTHEDGNDHGCVKTNTEADGNENGREVEVEVEVEQVQVDEEGVRMHVGGVRGILQRLAGTVLALFTGFLFSFTLVPFILWSQAQTEAPGPLDFIFTQYTGIWLASTALFLGYLSIYPTISVTIRDLKDFSERRRRGGTMEEPPVSWQMFFVQWKGSLMKLYEAVHMPTEIVGPSLLSGFLWGVANVGAMVATFTLGFTVGYPLIVILPGIVNSLWSVLVFREIRGKNILFLTIATLLGMLAVVCFVVSKLPPSAFGSLYPYLVFRL